jgi:hypothetical protein
MCSKVLEKSESSLLEGFPAFCLSTSMCSVNCDEEIELFTCKHNINLTLRCPVPGRTCAFLYLCFDCKCLSAFV